MLLQQKYFLHSLLFQVRIDSSGASSFCLFSSIMCVERIIRYFLFFFISFVCDGIDGWCARKFNQGTEFYHLPLPTLY